MSSRKTLLLIVAALVAVITMFLARSLMTPAPAPVEVAKQEVAIQNVQVLAATHDIPTGTILKDMDMKWIPWSAEAAQNGKFYIKDKTQMSDLVGAVMREGIHADEPLLAGRVVQIKDQGFLAAVLTPGKRAMSVTLTPSAGVAGFIFPGDHVDVILTHGFSRKDINELNDRYISETVITDVRVLALDQRSDNQNNDPKVAQLATLEVSPKQAEKLALATSLAGSGGRGSATLSLVLRSLAITDDKSTTTTTQNDNTTWDSDVSRAYPTVNGEDGLIQKVHVMRGKEVTESNFERRR